MCKKVNSKEELLALYDNVKDLLELRTTVNENPEKYHISVCGGTGCSSSNSLKIVEALKHWAKEYKVEDKVEISITGCFGFCERGPIVKIFPDHVFYTKVNEKKLKELFVVISVITISFITFYIRMNKVKEYLLKKTSISIKSKIESL